MKQQMRQYMATHDHILSDLIHQLTNLGVETTRLGIEILNPKPVWCIDTPARAFIRHAPDIFCRRDKQDCFIDIKLSPSKTDNLAIDLMSWAYSNNLKRMTLTDSYIMLETDNLIEIRNLKPTVIFIPSHNPLADYYKKLAHDFCAGARIQNLSSNKGSGDPFLLIPIKSSGRYILPPKSLKEIFA